MMIWKAIYTAVREVLRGIEITEAKKTTCIERGRLFLAERKSNSYTQKRIDAIQASMRQRRG